jgi:hypothetical protein
MKESNLIVLYNVLHGLFITHSENVKYFDEGINQNIAAYDEILILIEYSRATFERLDGFIQRAETKNLFFFRFDEETEDDITWIEVKGAESIVL